MSYDSVERPHQLLVIVIDINPNQLLFARQPGSLSQLMNSVTTLLSQHMMLHTTNQASLHLIASSEGLIQMSLLRSLWWPLIVPAALSYILTRISPTMTSF